MSPVSWAPLVGGRGGVLVGVTLALGGWLLVVSSPPSPAAGLSPAVCCGGLPCPLCWCVLGGVPFVGLPLLGVRLGSFPWGCWLCIVGWVIPSVGPEGNRASVPQHGTDFRFLPWGRPWSTRCGFWWLGRSLPARLASLGRLRRRPGLPASLGFVAPPFWVLGWSPLVPGLPGPSRPSRLGSGRVALSGCWGLGSPLGWWVGSPGVSLPLLSSARASSSAARSGVRGSALASLLGGASRGVLSPRGGPFFSPPLSPWPLFLPSLPSPLFPLSFGVALDLQEGGVRQAPTPVPTTCDSCN